MSIKTLVFESMRNMKRLLAGEVSTTKLRKMGMQIGENFSRQSGVRIDTSYPYLVEIGNNVSLAWNVIVLAHDASAKNTFGVTKVGRVKLEDNVFIGAGSIVLCGITIGKNSVVGAGIVVNCNIPENEVWGGVPARRIMSINDYKGKIAEGVNGYYLNADQVRTHFDNPNVMYCYQKCVNFNQIHHVQKGK